MNLFAKYQKALGAGFISDASWTSVQVGYGPFHAALIHHLDGDENKGQHNAFVDVIDADGLPMRPTGLYLGWTWDFRGDNEPAPPKAFDKPASEPGANVPINKGMVFSCWLQDESGYVLSDIVRGLRVDMEADPATGNSLFHHSYYIIFRLGQVSAPPAPVLTLEERVARIEKRLGL